MQIHRHRYVVGKRMVDRCNALRVLVQLSSVGMLEKILEARVQDITNSDN